LIKNGIVFQNGDNKAAFQRADIAIEGDRIKAVGNFLGVDADTTIDIKGRYVSPGFIDTHAHSNSLCFQTAGLKAKYRRVLLLR